MYKSQNRLLYLSITESFTQFVILPPLALFTIAPSEAPPKKESSINKSFISVAADKNIELITTSLTEKAAPDILADFEFNEEGTKVLRCPAGYAPKSCSYMKQSNQCAVSFLHEQCSNCPYQNQCRPKIFKRVAKIVTSKAAHERAKIQRSMNSEEFKNYARLRNGVETVPSNIRRNYHLEKMPRGKQRGKFFFGSKIAALNFRKFFNYVKGLGNYAQNPILA